VDGSAFRDLRRGSKLSGRELASLLGVSAETISRYENNHKPIPKTVQLAARYLCEPRTTNIIPRSPEWETVRKIRALLEELHG
jgi:transcriptional regulator with XRE-family HTH domain